MDNPNKRMMTINDSIVDKLSKFMAIKDISQYELAKMSGVPYPTVKSIMQKRTRSIDLKTVVLFARGLQVKPSEFIDDELLLSDYIDLD